GPRPHPGLPLSGQERARGRAVALLAGHAPHRVSHRGRGHRRPSDPRLRAARQYTTSRRASVALRVRWAGQGPALRWRLHLHRHREPERDLRAEPVSVAMLKTMPLLSGLAIVGLLAGCSHTVRVGTPKGTSLNAQVTFA